MWGLQEHSPCIKTTALYMRETASKGFEKLILRSKIILKTTAKHRREERILLKTAIDFRFL
jgi:hypothetical protein